MINFIACYIFAVPASTALAFLTPLWVYGLYLGFCLGPLVQTLMYGVLVLSIDWPRDARNAYDAARAE